MSFLTDFGDLAVLMPLATAILAWLIAARLRRTALWWLLALALCAGGIGLLKVYFVACGSPGVLQSPSGHSGLATLVYGALAVLVAREAGGWARLVAVGLGALLIVGITLSRILLGAHTPPDAAAGLLIGLAALAVFFRGTAAGPTASRSLRPLLVTAAAILVLLHGRELHAEAMLHAIGLYLKAGGVVCS